MDQPIESSSIRFVVIGLGAIGTYIGTSLIHAGQKVVFIERPEIAAQQNEVRLVLQGVDGQVITEKAQVRTIGADLFPGGTSTVVILAVKSFDTASAAGALQPYADRIEAVVSLQNGVDNEVLLAQALGAHKVISATVTSSISRRDVGDVVVERLRGIGLAEGHALTDALAAIFNQAGLKARTYRNALSMKWSKLLTNLQANAVPAVTGLTPVEVFAHPGLFKIEILQLREALAVMRALNLDVVNLPGAPVRLLAWMVEFLPLRLAQPLARRFLAGGRGGKMPSLYIDLKQGRVQTEVGDLNGAVIRYGEKLGVPTPVNRFLYDTMIKILSGEIQQNYYERDPDKLVRDIQGI